MRKRFVKSLFTFSKKLYYSNLSENAFKLESKTPRNEVENIYIRCDYFKTERDFEYVLDELECFGCNIDSMKNMVQKTVLVTTII